MNDLTDYATPLPRALTGRVMFLGMPFEAFGAAVILGVQILSWKLYLLLLAIPVGLAVLRWAYAEDQWNFASWVVLIRLTLSNRTRWSA